jgi:hypothetical protein
MLAPGPNDDAAAAATAVACIATPAPGCMRATAPLLLLLLVLLLLLLLLLLAVVVVRGSCGSAWCTAGPAAYCSSVLSSSSTTRDPTTSGTLYASGAALKAALSRSARLHAASTWRRSWSGTAPPCAAWCWWCGWWWCPFSMLG